MTCKTIDLGNGDYAIACSRGQRAKPCKFCGSAGTQLCDYPLRGKKEGQTCDARMCMRCAFELGPDLQYCPPHGRITQDQREQPVRCTKTPTK